MQVKAELHGRTSHLLLEKESPLVADSPLSSTSLWHLQILKARRRQAVVFHYKDYVKREAPSTLNLLSNCLSFYSMFCQILRSLPLYYLRIQGIAALLSHQC